MVIDFTLKQFELLVKFVEMQPTETMFWPALLHDQIPCTVSGAPTCSTLPRGLPAMCCAGQVATHVSYQLALADCG